MNPTDGIQPTTATGGPDNVFSRPDSPAGTIGTPDALGGSQTSWEQPPRKKRRMVRSPQMMALLELLKRYRVAVSFVTLTIVAAVAVGAIWGSEGSVAVVMLAILLGTFLKTIYDAWWDSGYPDSGRKQWEALVQKQRDKLKNQEGLR